MFRNLVKSNYGYSRRYFGPLQAAILDWSGTTADKYVIAPAKVFCQVFEKHGVPITMRESRQPMGLRKDLHIKKITEIPKVSSRWEAKYGRIPNDTDVQNMFKDFVPMQLNCLLQYSTLIPGTVETVNILRNDYQLKIGSTTGFTSSMVDILLKDAARQGYVPDSSVAGDSVMNGARPKPFMLYQNLELLNVHPIQSVLKVDDTVSGVGEGLEAGCWTVGLAKYSNYMDIDSLEHEMSLSPKEMEYKLEISRDILRKSGAHYVVDDITGLPDIVESINNRLNNGEKP
jgi:phosphonoacetaldehyde hydrolase